MGVIAKMQQTSVAPAVKRAADGLVSGFIPPVAGGRGDLGDRQSSVVGKVEAAVAAQAAALSQAAQKILDMPQVEPTRFQPLSTAESVIRYAGDFLPSWRAQFSIDLMPAVLVLIFCVVQAAIRREGEPAAADNMTAAQMLSPCGLSARWNGSRQTHRPRQKTPEAPLQPVIEENVMTLSTARAGKKD